MEERYGNYLSLAYWYGLLGACAVGSGVFLHGMAIENERMMLGGGIAAILSAGVILLSRDKAEQRKYSVLERGLD